ncbi:MAG TPA: potassium-transporting ATPase subunit KdpC [Patescibacteria group bacterium]|nr:potassium-transporting ATPase subunit KdpC [Patescibacteria group bacterium]
MFRKFIGALTMLLTLTMLTGFVYPLVVTGLAQRLFRQQASGSLLYKDGIVVGSRLIGQNFTLAGYFHGRPSAAGSDGYDGNSSGGSNLGPTNRKLVDAVRERVAQVREENHLDNRVAVPADLVTASASGLDPDISTAAAYLQVERVARERSLPAALVYSLVDSQQKGRQGGFLGEPRVNVLELNLALDGLQKP